MDTRLEMIRPESIFVGIPTRGALPSAASLMVWQRIRDTHPGLPAIRCCESKITVCHARNRIVKEFLLGNAEWLIMADDDVLPHPEVLRLSEHHLDIVASPCMVVRADALVPVPNIYDFSPTRGQHVPQVVALAGGALGKGAAPTLRGLRKADGVGTGCICIARKVLEHPALRAPFMLEFDDDGLVLVGEDFTFCKRARQAGFSVYADYDRYSDHVTPVSLLHLSNRYAEAMEIYAKHAQAAPEKERTTEAGIILLR